MISPCINICRIEPSSRLCLGCSRSMDEITQWARMSEAERQRIMADLPQRKGQTRDEPQRR
ncbi:DUF1289 domain-containing protein [Paracoccus aminophilus]|uniref:Fe-S protein n=1 Tax=Paracoccus aminophilus JCM 7686 TaxID=1367847 RepID=S5YX08_PARAH|nr:DUF1289 domain-containing protein [Paracoccus aminophilus]AGT09751.1 hypothetical protein JCM7686_2695 [Paracoccus aminophilus JCM 7686]